MVQPKIAQSNSKMVSVLPGYIFRNNFSNMISVGFPRKIIVNEDSQKFSYFYLFNMFIVNFYSKVKVWFIIVFIFKYHEISLIYI